MNTAVKKVNKRKWARFQPVKVDSYSFKLGNKLSSWFYCPVKDDEGFEYHFNALKDVSKKYVVINVDVVIGGLDVSIQIDQGGLDVLLKGLIPEKFISNVPPLLFQALFLKRFNKVFTYFESEFGYEIDVKNFTVLDSKKRVKTGSFCWDIFHEKKMKGELWISSGIEANKILEKIFFNMNNHFYPPFMHQVPMVLAVNLGCLSFSKKEFVTVEVGDVLMLDKKALGDKAQLLGTVNISPSFQSPVIIDGKQVVVKQELEEIVSKSSKESKKKANLEEVQLDITFKYGEKRLSFAELKKMGPGYVITLDKDLAGSMTILANGKRIGVGEIVQVGNRTGIRVLELYEGARDGSR